MNGKKRGYVIQRERERERDSMWGLLGAGSSVGVRLRRKKEHCSARGLLDSDTSSLHMETLHTGPLCLCVNLASFSKTRRQLTSHSLIHAHPQQCHHWPVSMIFTDQFEHVGAWLRHAAVCTGSEGRSAWISVKRKLYCCPEVQPSELPTNEIKRNKVISFWKVIFPEMPAASWSYIAKNILTSHFWLLNIKNLKIIAWLRLSHMFTVQSSTLKCNCLNTSAATIKTLFCVEKLVYLLRL